LVVNWPARGKNLGDSGANVIVTVDRARSRNGNVTSRNDYFFSSFDLGDNPQQPRPGVADLDGDGHGEPHASAGAFPP
jgi:hypothetical protein